MRKILLLSAAAFLTACLLSYTFKVKQPVPLSAECYIGCFNTAYPPNDTWQKSLEEFANPAFQMLHDNPKPFVLQNPKGSIIEFAATDGKNAQGYFLPAKKKSNQWLFVIQEWWGLNDYIKLEAEKYYGDLENVNVLAIDMYDGKVATTRDSAAKYVQAATKERLETIVNAAITYAGKKAKIYTVGWCFGGMWSLQASILAGNKAAGCIMFYGRPENDMNKLKALQCDVIGFFGNKDKGPSPEMVAAFEKNMVEAGKNLTAHKYEAGHGFANPSNPNFNKEATDDAYAKAILFLKERIK